MTIELASKHKVPKPWGQPETGAWTSSRSTSDAIGEIWFDRAVAQPLASSLLLKIILTSQPLSVQVHPDDKFAALLGMPQGKTEAWYILSAAPGAQVALGPKVSTSTDVLRNAIAEDRLLDLLNWQDVHAGQVVYVPAGTVHAIGAGLVIAEIQQRSDSTFRMFDFGRQRELHIEDALAVAKTEPIAFQAQPREISSSRSVLLANLHFVFERIVLPPRTKWRFEADRETWILATEGTGRIAAIDLVKGDAVFLQSENTTIQVGETGLTALVSYTGPNVSRRLLKQIRSNAFARVAQKPPPTVTIASIATEMKGAF